MDEEKNRSETDISSEISHKIDQIVMEEEMEHAKRERLQKAADFRLTLDLDAEFGDLLSPKAEPAEKPKASGQTTAILTEVMEKAAAQAATDEASASAEEMAEPTADDESESAAQSDKKWGAPVRITDEPDIPEEPMETEEHHHGKKGGKYSRVRGCLRVVTYFLIVFAVSIVLAYFLVTGALDMLGFNKSAAKVDVTVPEDASVGEIATILQDNDLISQPLMFRLFVGVVHSGEKFESGVFTLSANQGYQGLVSSLQNVEREEVTVTFREGLTVKQVAETLEENDICTADEFLQELETGDFSEYDFVKDIPKNGEGSDRPYRIYRMEGYLFPDTYTFYTESSPHTAICKFLDAFEIRVDTKIRTAIKANGLSLDEALTLASILEMEADNSEDMAKVARVLLNRLDNPAEFRHLQSDVTEEYVNKIYSGLDEKSPIYQAYSTYICDGLPTGPICNPGLAALRAVAYPNEDSDIVNCYYFATDSSQDPPVTYYSETYAEHIAICEKYDLGIHADN